MPPLHAGSDVPAGLGTIEEQPQLLVFRKRLPETDTDLVEISQLLLRLDMVLEEFLPGKL